ncbi:hypothetical protein HOY80DRAFT_477791 [Tuber brumale]|nr:hypothetical protein HOY80DRAFT_477791 [Tuber brumale]
MSSLFSFSSLLPRWGSLLLFPLFLSHCFSFFLLISSHRAGIFHLFSSLSPFEISNSLFTSLSLTGSRSILCGFCFPLLFILSPCFLSSFFLQKYHKGLAWDGYVDMDELMTSQWRGFGLDGGLPSPLARVVSDETYGIISPIFPTFARFMLLRSFFQVLGLL